MRTILIGTLEGLSHLRSGNETVLLTTLKETSNLDTVTHPVPNVREMEGQVAVVRGFLKAGVLHSAEVVEVLPPIASGITKDLLGEGILSIQNLQARMEAVLRGVVGDPEPAPPVVPEKTCALVVGHRPGARGAVNEARGLTEFTYNDALATLIKAKVSKAAVEIVHRDDDANGYSRLPSKINALNPHFIISLHCNAFNKRATGTEMLYHVNSSRGQKIARILQPRVVEALDLKNRHTKKVAAGGRGWLLLNNTNAPCVIAEPFFIDNDSDLQAADNRRTQLIAAYAAAIDEVAETL